MDENRIDEVPMLLDSQLQQSDDYYDSRHWNFASRMCSTSMSIPSNSMDSNENISNLVGHTGPLRSERKSSFSPLSGPLYIVQRTETPFLLNRGAAARKIVTEKFPSFSIQDQNDWPEDKDAGKNQNLLRSGQLGMCNNPYCTMCPTYYNSKASEQKTSKSSVSDSNKLYNSLHGDAKHRAKRLFSYLRPSLPGVMNPHTKLVQQWNKFFVISCLVAVFVDPLFFFPLSVEKGNKCIVLDWTMTKLVVVLRTMTDFIHFVHILLQFRLAYIAPESRVVGAGELVDHPKKIALHYIRGYFFVDLFIAFPLPQIMILLVVPRSRGLATANYAKNLLRASVLIPYVPRLYRILPMLGGQSSSGFIFESAWANFVINLLTFVLSGHVVGSCWYLFGLQRVNQCLRDACHKFEMCMFMDCGCGDNTKYFSQNATLNATWNNWKNYTDAIDCFSKDSQFDFGIYQRAVNLTTEYHSVITRYVYSLFWGFQQISTLAGNQTPSYFVWEILFTMSIIGLGLLLFALLISNMQNFLQALGQRRLEMSLRRRDFEQWMSHRQLPEKLKRKVHEAERYNWAATRGVNEEMLLDYLPEDLQREIRRHLCKFVKKVRIFAFMEDPLLDAICEKLRQKTYIKGSKIMCPRNLVEKMVFVIRGKLESSGEDGLIHLSEGDVCGEELLAWCLENRSVNKEGKRIRLPGYRRLSTRMVKCLTNVEAFVLRATDLEEVTSLYARFLRNPRLQGAIRYVSPYWRGLAATQIQVAWKYRKKRLSRADTSQSHHLFN